MKAHFENVQSPKIDRLGLGLEDKFKTHEEPVCLSSFACKHLVTHGIRTIEWLSTPPIGIVSFNYRNCAVVTTP